MRINDGVQLYLEDFTMKYPGVENFSFISEELYCRKWEIEFELEKNRFTIKFNIPLEDGKECEPKFDETPVGVGDGEIRAGVAKLASSVDYDQSIVMDQRMSVLDMKIKIAKVLGLGLEYLIFIRGGAHGTEIKEDDISIKAAHLYNMVCIYLQVGTPSKQNEKRLSFIIAETLTKVDQETIMETENGDNMFYQMRELIEIPVNTRKTTLDVKKFLISNLEGTDLKPDLMRFREKIGDKMGKVYRDQDILEQYYMHEGKEIAIQQLTEPEVVEDDMNLIIFRVWNPSTWELSPVTELYVKRYQTLHELCEQLNKVYPFVTSESL